MVKINIRRFRILKKTKINSDCKGNKQNSKAAQVSLVGKNPPKGLPIGEPGPSKPMSGKETKKNRIRILCQHVLKRLKAVSADKQYL